MSRSKSFLELIEKVPGWILYILFIFFMILFVSLFPKLSYLIGLLYEYALYIFFGGMFIFLIIFHFFNNKE